MTTCAGWWLDDHAGSATAVLTLALAVATALYVRLTHGLVKAAKTDRADRLALLRSEQARLVGCYLAVSGVHGEKQRYTAHLINASPLPVQAVDARLNHVDTEGLVAEFARVPVLVPGESDVHVDVPSELRDKLYLTLDFKDDAGTRWQKYGGDNLPLRRVEPDKGREAEPGARAAVSSS